MVITIPDTIKGQDRKNAEEAVKAYTKAQQVINLSRRDPKSSTVDGWTEQIEKHLAPPESTKALDNIAGFQADGVHQTGWARIVGSVAATKGPNVTISVCEDDSQFDIVDASGKSYISSAGLMRIARIAHVSQWSDGWRVGKVDTPDPAESC